MYLPAMDGGGAEMVFALLTRAFIARGHRVDLVLNAARGPTLAHIDPATNVVDLGASRSLAALPRLARYLRNARPAALLSALEISNVIAVWARAMSQTSTRAVVSVHAIASVALARNRRWQYRYLKPVMSRAYGQADAIVAVSDGVADDLAALTGLPRDTITRIYNPLPPNIQALAEQDAAVTWCRTDMPTVLAVGRLVPEKDFETLLRAFARLRDRRRVQLVILGDGPEKQRLSALVRSLDLENDVQFPGYVANPYAHMRKASVLAVSSIAEGFGNVIVESLACGTPVVSTRCPGGPAEILGHGRYGTLVPVGDVAALSSALEQSLDAPHRDDLPQRAAEFRLDRIAGEYLEALAV
jgi:glycosyltransferase involved in cell wall biosynthesis